MTRTWTHWISLAGVALGSIACTGQPDPTQRPEALGSSAEPAPADHKQHRPAVEPALLWLVDEDETGGDASFVGFTVDVRGRFPSRFRLRLTDPPPEEAFFRAESFRELVGDTGLELAIGSVVAARKGLLTENPTTVSPDVVDDPERIRGDVEKYDLLFLNQDVEPGPVSDELFGGATPSAGYHLLSTETGQEAPDGLDTRLRIVFRDQDERDGQR
jgi:hypothetical protein